MSRPPGEIALMNIPPKLLRSSGVPVAAPWATLCPNPLPPKVLIASPIAPVPCSLGAAESI